MLPGMALSLSGLRRIPPRAAFIGTNNSALTSQVQWIRHHLSLAFRDDRVYIALDNVPWYPRLAAVFYP